MSNKNWVVAIGNPFDGMTLIGPFLDSVACEAYIQENRLDKDNYLCTILSPPFPIDYSSQDSLDKDFGPDMDRVNSGVGQ